MVTSVDNHVAGEVTIPVAENEQLRSEADEAEMMKQLREELKSLTVSDHMLFMMQSLAALAVERMGLAEEAGGRRDPDEARLAIDAFRALLEVVGRARTPEEMAAQRSVLSQLQISYVAGLGHGGAEEAPSAAAADESPEGPAAAPTDAPADMPVETPDEAQADVPPEAAAEAPTGEPEGQD